MAFIRWNDLTQIWEKANTPTDPITSFVHLPVANPTQPLDIANKAYVDSMVGGGGVVNAISATAAANPTPGLPTNASLTATFTFAFGIVVGHSNFGHTWVQAQRVDNFNSDVYNLYLQPRANTANTYGNVGIGMAGDSSLKARLTVGGGGVPWTTFGWARAIELPASNILKWTNAGTHYWGMASAGDNQFYIGYATVDNTSGPFNSVVVLGTGGNTTFYGNLIVNGAILAQGYGGFQGYWGGWTIQWKSYGGSDGVIGNGALNGRYTVIGKTVHYSINLVIGSTTTLPSGIWAFKLPLPSSTIVMAGSVTMRTNAGQIFRGTIVPGAFYLGIADSIAIVTTIVGSTANDFVVTGFPIPWTTGDSLFLNGTYEIA